MKDKTILLIEDETDVLLANQEYLTAKGMRVLAAESLGEAEAILARTVPDIILLDVLLPDGSGFDYIQEIRKKVLVPVIFLTCLCETDDVVKGLLGGGCDYMTKPYSLEELYARVLVHLRVTREIADQNQKLVLDNITLNLETNRAYLEGVDVVLKPMEFYLLAYLVRNRDRIITGEELYLAVWGRGTNGDTRTVRVHIHELRKKLKMPKDDSTGQFPYLETVFGKGYCLRTDRVKCC